jgi:hypothetical protein
MKEEFKTKENNGIRRTFWMQHDLDAKVEEARAKLGLGRSGFYRFCVIETLKSMLSEPRKELEAQ